MRITGDKSGMLAGKCAQHIFQAGWGGEGGDLASDLASAHLICLLKHDVILTAGCANDMPEHLIRPAQVIITSRAHPSTTEGHAQQQQHTCTANMHSLTAAWQEIAHIMVLVLSSASCPGAAGRQASVSKSQAALAASGLLLTRDAVQMSHLSK
jgi:hypothetical protein